MLKKLLLSITLLISWNVLAEDAVVEPAQSAFYHMVHPTLVVNYQRTSKRLGFLRFQVQLMVPTEEDKENTAYYVPLIKHEIINFMSAAPESKIRSLEGKEELRLQVTEVVQQALEKETGNPTIKEVLFTQYMYN